MKKIKIVYLLSLILYSTFYANAQLVVTVAGQLEIPGSNDAPAFEATFNNPHGIAVDHQGSVYTTDRWSHTIRKITIDGMVSTLAGSQGVSGDTDGIGNAALFNEPWGLCVDHLRNVYVADTRNNKIRKITPDGVVSTIAGSGNFGSSNGFGTAATFGNPTGIECDLDGNIYVADHLTHIIRKISPSGMVTTIAGKPYTMGSNDGVGTEATFARPYGLELDHEGNILIADEWNHKIRKIASDGMVSTIAGNGVVGHQDGYDVNTSFNYPWDMTVDSSGNIFVADGYNYVVRKITPEGIVTTYAGNPEIPGGVDGVGPLATFNGATAIAFSPLTEELYVGDAYNHLVRKIVDLNQDVTLFTNESISNICEGESLNFNASPNVYESYSFFIDDMLYQESTSSNCTIENLEAGTHTIKVIITKDGNTQVSNEIIVTVLAAEIPTISLVGETSFYEGDSLTLISSAASSYFWSTGEITPTITVFESGTYTVEVADENSCIGISDPIEVTVIPAAAAPIISIEGSTSLCPNESSTLQSNFPQNNQWFLNGWPLEGAISQSLEISEGGSYQVQVLNNNGVNVFSEAIEITVLDDLIFTFEANKTILAKGEEITFSPSIQNGISYRWNFGDNNTSSDMIANHSYEEVGTYSVSLSITDEDGCIHQLLLADFVRVEDREVGTGNIFVPNAFTPNGDGCNDALFVRGLGVSNIDFKVFNQWGEQVFFTTDMSVAWDGKHNAQWVKNGTYVYVLQYTDWNGKDEILKGHVSVIR